MKWLATAWVVLLLVLHQDIWLWTDKTLVGGFLPMGLAYHAGFTVVASITLFVFTRRFWPRHLEAAEAETQTIRGGGHP